MKLLRWLALLPALVQAQATIINGQSVTLTPPPGLTFIAQDSPTGPAVNDHGQDGSGTVNAAWLIAGVGAVQPYLATNPLCNTTNRAAPFQALGSQVWTGPTPFVTTFLAGCHYQGGGNSGNDVAVTTAYATPGTTGSRLWTSVWSFYYKEDTNWWFAQGADESVLTLQATAGSKVLTTSSDVSMIPTGWAPAAAYAVNGGTGNIPTYENGQALKLGGDNSANIVTATAPGTVTMALPALASGPVNVMFIAAGLDQNNKILEAGDAPQAYLSQQSFYLSFGSNPQTQVINGTTYVVSHPNVNTDAVAKIAWTDESGGSFMQNPDERGNNNYWSFIIPPALKPGLAVTNFPAGIPYGGWVKVEVFFVYSDVLNGPGQIQWYEFNQPSAGPGPVSANGQMNYHGRTVSAALTTKMFHETLGGYARDIGANSAGQFTQWRGFGDAINIRNVAHPSFARVVFVSHTRTYARGNGVFDEMQSWTQWTPGGPGVGSITLPFRAGNLPPGLIDAVYSDEFNSVPPTVLATYNYVAAGAITPTAPLGVTVQ